METIDEILELHKLKSVIDRRNRATIKANQPKIDRGELKKNKLEQYPVDLKEFSDRERVIQRALDMKPPEDWVKDIDKIPTIARRKKAACLIWWDYFSARNTSEAWPHLDKYLIMKLEPVENDDLYHDLLSCGYNKYKAWTRAYLEPRK